MNKAQFIQQFNAFAIGQMVTKTKGSQWTGKVVGVYSTALTPEGYAVESDTEKGSVQIYPVSALKSVFEKDESDKFIITRDHEYVLFETLKQYLPVLSVCVDPDSGLSAVFKAKFIPGRQIKVEVEGHYVDYNKPKDIFDDKIINVAADWTNNNVLWFRLNKGEFEAFIDYVDEYRDTFALLNDKNSPFFSMPVTL